MLRRSAVLLTALSLWFASTSPPDAACLMPSGEHSYRFQEEKGWSPIDLISSLFRSGDDLGYQRFKIEENANGECVVTTSEDIEIRGVKSESKRTEFWSGNRVHRFESHTTMEKQQGDVAVFLAVGILGEYSGGLTKITVIYEKKDKHDRIISKHDRIYEVDGMVLPDSVWNYHILTRRRVIDPRSGMCIDIDVVDPNPQEKLAELTTGTYKDICGIERTITYDSGLFDSLEVPIGLGAKLFLRRESSTHLPEQWRSWGSVRLEPDGKRSCPIKDTKKKRFDWNDYCPLGTPILQPEEKGGP